ncbi:hypothetical protein [Vibrio sonorensis]|uniref:hypothetical protein n=1 Tax=Vibrio sonorensis TaxID=1004316 RepID=UPI0008D908F4|nr:hypothetical protein [Vibrio sonorensis]
MKNINLRFPYVLYLAVICVLVGVIIAPDVTSEPENHDTHYNHDHSMEHGMINVAPESAPTIAVELIKDTSAGWNLVVDTTNFTFTPELVNLANVDNQGHAHIYVNGEKLARLYAHHYHLSDFPPGDYEIKVSLNANNHDAFAINGKPIVAIATISENSVE